MTNFSNNYVLLVNCVTLIGLALILGLAILGLVKNRGNESLKILFIVLFLPLWVVYKLFFSVNRCICGHAHPCSCSCPECQNMYLIYMD